MNATEAESILRRLIDEKCVAIGIRYEKDDGSPASWRLIHSPSMKKGKAASVLRGREENSDTSKSWKLSGIRDIYLPDSPRLCVTSWLLDTPIRFDRPIATPSGGRVKVIQVFADIDFRVVDRSIRFVNARLSTTSNICGAIVNVCSNRSGQAWAADWSLSWTVSRYLKKMSLDEINNNEQLRQAMWRRFAGWWRNSGQMPFSSYRKTASGIMSIFSWLTS